MLLKLLTQFDKDGGPECEVLCLSGSGQLEPAIATLGVSITNLGMAPGLGAFLKYARLQAAITKSKPDIIQTWMYHANLMGALTKIWHSNTPLVWGLRQSNLDRTRSKKRTIMVAHAGAYLSHRFPESIVCVSDTARDVHVAMGYAAAKMLIIPNGFDADEFRPDMAARAEVRAGLGINKSSPVVGLIARFDSQKDHRTFFDASRAVYNKYPDAIFVLCGENIDSTNQALIHMISEAGLENNVRLLGRRDDIARITAALDVAVSSSAYGEGFSNALGEALLCGVPVVATDVGESRSIVRDAGFVVPPEDTLALGSSIGALIALDPLARRRLGALGREHMSRHYGIATIARRYKSLYEEILAARGGRR